MKNKTTKEIWKDIKEYKGKYQISNLGRVKSVNYNRTSEEKILKLQKDRYGYSRVNLYENGRHKFLLIHRLEAETFIPNLLNKPQVNHINGTKTDNRVCNLEWATSSENMKHAFKTGLSKIKHRGEHHFAKKVVQYDKQGNFIKEWTCILDASKQTKINNSNIGGCCQGKRKTAGNFKWRYADEIEKHIITRS